MHLSVPISPFNNLTHVITAEETKIHKNTRIRAYSYLGWNETIPQVKKVNNPTGVRHV